MQARGGQRPSRATSLMDTRHVWGDEGIYRQLANRDRLILDTDPLDQDRKIEGEIHKSSEIIRAYDLSSGTSSERGTGFVTIYPVDSAAGSHGIRLQGPGRFTYSRHMWAQALEDAKTGVSFLAEVRTTFLFYCGQARNIVEIRRPGRRGRTNGIHGYC